ncbi:MAG: hypothetical protein RIC55_15430 [Pirellulaceae bacterium]
METTLHRQLKQHYADDEGQMEVPLGKYRIDAIAGDWLVEIQNGTLSAIRDKIRVLLKKHRVLVVKPLVVRKHLVKTAGRGGAVVKRRLSPKRASHLDIFHDLVHFTGVFPHARLAIECPLIEIEEWRHPGHGRRRRWRERDHEVEDQRLVAVLDTLRLETAGDLLTMLPSGLPRQFDTGELAEGLGVDRWIAQRVAYCLRKTGAAVSVGKRGNAHLYEIQRRTRVRKRKSVA